MGCSGVIGRKVVPNDRLVLQATSEIDPEETFDLRRPERQLSEVKPPLISWLGTSVCRPQRPLSISLEGDRRF